MGGVRTKAYRGLGEDAPDLVRPLDDRRQMRVVMRRKPVAACDRHDTVEPARKGIEIAVLQPAGTLGAAADHDVLGAESGGCLRSALDAGKLLLEDIAE